MSLFLSQFVLPLCLFAVLLFWAKDRPWPLWLRGLLTAAVFFVAFLVASFIQRKTTAQHWVIAGTVEDEATREGVGQADVFLEGINSRSTTEDNGNFRIELKGKMRNGEPLRIKVTKVGYRASEETVTPPQDSIIVLLPKL